MALGYRGRQGARAHRGAIGWIVAAALLAPGMAHAAWYRAETDRFIVYGEGGEQKVRDYAVKLTTFDWVLRLFHQETKDWKASTKLVVYLVNSRDDLRRVRPALPKQVAGFYMAMNEGVFAVGVNEEAMGADDVLFHEYAHHFMLENFPAAYPAWFVEGFAEYFMTVDIKPTSVTIGGYNPGRVYSIFNEPWLPLDELLSKTTWETNKNRQAAYYSEAWLLMHYMRATPERARQLDAAAKAIAQGVAPAKAMQDATGMSLDDLTKALKAYRKIPTLMLKGPRADVTSQVTVTAMPKSSDDLLLDNLHLILWPTGRVDAPFLADVRRKAAKYPGDTLAEMTLARAEFVMGDVAAGEAILKRRLDASPNDKEDLLLAGTGQLMAGMRDRPHREARWKAARPLLAKAYAVDKADFRILYAYGLSRSIEPAYPTENDLTALLEARALAPAVMENSLRAGLALVQKGRKAEAARVLAPVINSPHGGRAAAQAKALLEGVKPGDTVTIEAGEDEDEAPPPGPAPKPAA